MTPTAGNEITQVVDRIEDRYDVGDLLGEGAMGRVFAARDAVLGVDVALKVMHQRHVGAPSFMSLFGHEAIVSARVRSPHVVKVLAVGMTRSGAPCIVYERLEGETLGQRLAREGGLPVSETIDLVKQVARALAHAHAHRVVHCDVKPDNIFLTCDAAGRTHVKLLDFGIAETADGNGTYAQGELRGTPEYMAPELLLSTHQLDVQADLYALGVVAFECLTGRCPFEGGLEEVVTMLRSGARATFAELRPDFGSPMNDWIDHALDADPFWRFGSAKELSDALESAYAPTVGFWTSQVERLLEWDAA